VTTVAAAAARYGGVLLMRCCPMSTPAHSSTRRASAPVRGRTHAIGIVGDRFPASAPVRGRTRPVGRCGRTWGRRDPGSAAVEAPQQRFQEGAGDRAAGGPGLGLRRAQASAWAAMRTLVSRTGGATRPGWCRLPCGAYLNWRLADVSSPPPAPAMAVRTSLPEAVRKYGAVVRSAGGAIFGIQIGPSLGSRQKEKLQIGTADGFVKFAVSLNQPDIDAVLRERTAILVRHAEALRTSSRPTLSGSSIPGAPPRRRFVIPLRDRKLVLFSRRQWRLTRCGPGWCR
jgi:hypothetical protein